MKKYVKTFKKHLWMKATIFDESQRPIYKSEGDPKKVIKELVHFGRFGLSIIDKSDVLDSFDFLGLSKAIEEKRKDD